MCGIAGMVVDDGLGERIELARLERMVGVLRHRGPDEYGLYHDTSVSLAHSRLSVIDVAGGAQPMANEHGSVWVVVNGEVFNYVELRAELRRRGHTFQTSSDTEVIVHGYEEYGEGCWERLNGQFAIALWDRRQRLLYLVRDRLGIRPLYYARVGGRLRLIFGSEVKSIFASGYVDRRFDPLGLAETFCLWSAVPSRSVFSGVPAVEPGCFVVGGPGRAERSHRYWDLSFDECPERRNGQGQREWVDGLRERLVEAVRLRLRADVPVGAYLSGGLDSSVIAALVKSAGISGLRTFSVRFEDKQFDETEHQRRMIGALGTEHSEVVCRSADVAEVFPDVVWHAEAPLLRTAPAPLFLLSRLVNEHGMKVVLSGEGADEILAGYNIFKEAKIRRFWARQPDSKLRPLLLDGLYGYVSRDRGRAGAYWREFFRQGLTDVDDPFYSHRLRWGNGSWALRLLSPAVRERFGLEAVEGSVRQRLCGSFGSWGVVERAQYLEMSTFLPGYLLSSQGDRMAMGHSVEGRFPFLDHHVVEYCAGLPTAAKLQGLRDKVSLRRLGSELVPAEISSRSKQPYRAPTTECFFGGGAPDWVTELTSEQALGESGAIDAGNATWLINKAKRQGGRMASEREAMALIGLLSVQLVWRLFMKGFDARVQASFVQMQRERPRVLVDLAGAAGAGNPDWKV